MITGGHDNQHAAVSLLSRARCARACMTCFVTRGIIDKKHYETFLPIRQAGAMRKNDEFTPP